ncbi:MAG: DUF5337 domain-containing protein [Pseudomonadota bacterium]
MAKDKDSPNKAGQRIALIIAGFGVFWVLANLIGSEYGWSNRTRALFDLIALGGFAWGFVMAIGMWRARK